MKNLIVFTFIVFLPYVFSCPENKELSPCFCDSVTETAYITCVGLENDESLSHAASSLAHMKNIYSFSIDKALLRYIPHDAFKEVNFTELEIRDSALVSLTDEDVAFEGLEDSLEVLLIQNSGFLNEWNWSALRNLAKLRTLEITGTDLESVEKDMGEIMAPELRDITLDNNRISHINSRAFGRFSELTFLSLSHNRISDMRRSMLPNPATMLMNVDLSFNFIKILARDFFRNMPVLGYVDLRENSLKALDERTFSPVWKQLTKFDTTGNRLSCDCRMVWVMKTKGPENLHSVCAEPGYLRERKIQTLTSNDISC